MTKPRPFRFGVQAHHAASARQWRETARSVEAMGYSALYVPDHFSDLPGPIAALTAAADATSTLRVGSLVFDNDYRHPVVLAKEAATIDLLSDGRFDLGLGAGWMTSDYEKSGIALESAGTRIDRMVEGLQVIKGLMAEGSFSFSGKHYQVTELEGTPKPVQKPHPPVLLGGGGRRMLGIAGREADIVNINYNLQEGRISRKMVRTGMASATDDKLAWIKDAAGERFDQLELSVTIFVATITDDRDSIAEAMGSGLDMDAAEVLAIPHFLLGTLEQIVEDLQARRERYGISYVIVPGEVAEQVAPIVERLAGS
ncbi:MAG TPA: TIGR03621 family F420-dependent LLM class oxidoreductase [Candidatus Dormibacteraeota bacterium]|nr:TIGR03621 family F420-dependent LLM class oxidoreductase [Candidatus Dormibacteraeota bacterium]